MANVKVGAIVRHRITGATGQIVAGPRRASRGMRWVLWDGLGDVRPSAPRQSSSNVLIVAVVAPEDRGMTTDEFEAHHGRKPEVDDILAAWRRLPGRGGR